MRIFKTPFRALGHVNSQIEILLKVGNRSSPFWRQHIKMSFPRPSQSTHKTISWKPFYNMSSGARSTTLVKLYKFRNFYILVHCIYPLPLSSKLLSIYFLSTLSSHILSFSLRLMKSPSSLFIHFYSAIKIHYTLTNVL